MKIATLKYFALVAVAILGQSRKASSQVQGCTDPLATNYNIAATVNDGSCIYPSATLSPTSSVILPDQLNQVSGAVWYNNRIWVHNDHTDQTLYELDTLSGEILANHLIPQALHEDWEALAQDSTYFYIGDFGNNAGGNRTDLHILRVEKSSLDSGQPLTSNIGFSYSDQTNFQSVGSNNTNYDCEAIIATNNALFLFTKQWLNQKTRIYAVPKISGNFTVSASDSLEVDGLITDATYLPDKNLMVLLGYSNTIQPFFYLCYDFFANGFFNGNKRKININLPYHKTEGITTQNGLKYYVLNEALTVPQIINVPQQMHIFDLSPYLEGYLTETALHEPSPSIQESSLQLFPNPVEDVLHLVLPENTQQPEHLILYDMQGKDINLLPCHIFANSLNNSLIIDLNWLPQGNYFLTTTNQQTYIAKIIKN